MLASGQLLYKSLERPTFDSKGDFVMNIWLITLITKELKRREELLNDYSSAADFSGSSLLSTGRAAASE